jgi:Tfp pilus assembly protein PilO
MKPKQLYFMLLALTVTLALATIAVFILSQRKIDSKITKIQHLSADVELQDDRLTELKRLEKDYQELLPLINKVKNILPEQKQQAEIIAQISTLATQSNLELTNLSFQSTTGLPGPTSQTENATIGGIKTMPVSFKITGSFSQLLNLLEKFEHQERFMQVNSLAVSKTEDNQLTVDLQLVVFLKP